MSLRTPDTVKQGIEQLLSDVGPLHTVSVFAFDEVKAEKVEGNLARAKAIPDTMWIDLRDVDDGVSRARLTAEALRPGTLVLVLGSGRPTLAVSSFLRQVADRRDVVNLGEGVQVPRDPKQSVIVVACGIAEHSQAPLELRRIDYWLLARQLA